MLVPWLERISLPLRTGKKFVPFERHDLEMILHSTPYANAQIVYRDLVRVQCNEEASVAVLGRCVPSPEAAHRFRQCLLDRGVLMDMLMDRIQLQTELRREKWEAERRERREGAEAQRRAARREEQRSTYRMRERGEEEAAFRSERAKIGRQLLRRRGHVAWLRTLLLAPDAAALSAMPPSFWLDVRTSSYSLSERRAAAHRLRSCVRHASHALPLLRRVEEENYLASHGVEEHGGLEHGGLEEEKSVSPRAAASPPAKGRRVVQRGRPPRLASALACLFACARSPPSPPAPPPSPHMRGAVSPSKGQGRARRASAYETEESGGGEAEERGSLLLPSALFPRRARGRGREGSALGVERAGATHSLRDG